jgi:mannose-6-phosphate isomerase-like protein (cupin superfamily)
MKRFAALAIALAGVAVFAIATYAQKAAEGPRPLVINVESVMGAELDPHKTEITDTPMGQTATSSARVLMVRDDIPPQSHVEHDQILLVLRGKGDLTLGGHPRDVARGSLVFIPKGTVYSFVNTGGGFAGLLSVMTPPFDGKDVVLEKKKP